VVFKEDLAKVEWRYLLFSIIINEIFKNMFLLFFWILSIFYFLFVFFIK
jgi:hypothetical protein